MTKCDELRKKRNRLLAELENPKLSFWKYTQLRNQLYYVEMDLEAMDDCQ